MRYPLNFGPYGNDSMTWPTTSSRTASKSPAVFMSSVLPRRSKLLPVDLPCAFHRVSPVAVLRSSHRTDTVTGV